MLNDTELKEVRELAKIDIQASGPKTFYSILAYVKHQGPEKCEDWELCEQLNTLIVEGEIRLGDMPGTFDAA